MKFRYFSQNKRKSKNIYHTCVVITIFMIFCFSPTLPGCNNTGQAMVEIVKEQQPNAFLEKETIQSNDQPEENQPTNNTGNEPASKQVKEGSKTSKTDPAGNSSKENISKQLIEKDAGDDDLKTSRDYFRKGIEFFEDKKYVIAEYYFNKIKDDYDILSDHSLYYYAKSLLMQEKYDIAEESYLKLKTEFTDSIFKEKTTLEYADLFFMKQDYSRAEIAYRTFIETFLESDFFIYSKYQLAICQRNNDNIEQSFENFKDIWLQHPESDYAQKAIEAIESLQEDGLIEEFKPTDNEIYRRGEIFFDLYWYENALDQFKIILDKYKQEELDGGLVAKTLFKSGMCYYNMRDYSTAKEYLEECYDKFPSGSFTDDCLYFLGRAYTNLDMDLTAIEKYKEVLSRFPQSNYADDSLYRIARIYFFNDDLQGAEEYYQRVLNEYPGGDRVTEVYWALGWIQYRNADYGSAKITFAGMADSFGSSSLGEKGLFWKAKCSEQLGQIDNAVQDYKKLISFNSFSYYTFAAKQALQGLGEEVELKRINTSVYPENPDIEDLLPDVFLKDKQGSKATGKTAMETQGFSHIDKAKELLVIELYDSADAEIEAASSEIEDNSTGILEISTLYLKAKDYINSQKIISKNFDSLKNSLSPPYEDYLYFLLYPYGFKEYVDKYSGIYNIDPLYILAIIREESRFKTDAGSHAGALGLMQIMPNTGKSIAASTGISGFNNDMLFDPEKNIMMGTYYIRAQLDSFGQNKYYACGAYNGGPGAMNKWLLKHGDKDIDEFIENISFEETKLYIKKVMGSYFFYQLLYGSTGQ